MLGIQAAGLVSTSLALCAAVPLGDLVGSADRRGRSDTFKNANRLMAPEAFTPFHICSHRRVNPVNRPLLRLLSVSHSLSSEVERSVMPRMQFRGGTSGN